VSFLKTNPLKYPIVADAKDISNLFGIKGYPTNIVIDKNGYYYSQYLGGIPEIGKQISGSIKDALSNKLPTPPSQPKNEMNIKSGSVLTPATSTTMRIDPNSIFKMENGEIIKIDKAMELLNSNEYVLETKKDEKGNDYYLIKKRSKKK
jgi:hypothetical protein